MGSLFNIQYKSAHSFSIAVNSVKAGTIGLACLCILSSCRQHSSGQTGKARLKTEYCIRDTGNSYELYLPENYSACKSVPVIIILDPHGSGKHAIKQFIKTAGQYHCMLAASNQVRNNFDGFIGSIQTLIGDIQTKFPFAGTVYIAGFSGGARMALAYAQSHKTGGILACGALAGKDQVKAIPATIFSITGMGDFNFSETAVFLLNPGSIPPNLKIEFTAEIHEWPSSDMLAWAMGFFILGSEDTGSGCIDRKKLLDEFCQTSAARIDSLVRSHSLLQASVSCRNIGSMKNASYTRHLRKSCDSIAASKGLNEEMALLGSSLQFEFKAREAYYNALTTKEPEWWKHEIGELNRLIDNSTERYTKYTYIRIKAYLGIVCYTIEKNLLQTGDLDKAAKILAIYRLAEPENPDMFYFSAVYSYKRGNTAEAEKLLKQAVNRGYSDTLQIHHDFPQRMIEKFSATE